MKAQETFTSVKHLSTLPTFFFRGPTSSCPALSRPCYVPSLASNYPAPYPSNFHLPHCSPHSLTLPHSFQQGSPSSAPLPSLSPELTHLPTPLAPSHLSLLFPFLKPLAIHPTPLYPILESLAPPRPTSPCPSPTHILPGSPSISSSSLINQDLA